VLRACCAWSFACCSAASSTAALTPESLRALH